MSAVASPKRLVKRWSVRGPNGRACAGHRRGSMLFWPYAPLCLMTPTMRSVSSTLFLWLDYLQLFHTPLCIGEVCISEVYGVKLSTAETSSRETRIDKISTTEVSIGQISIVEIGSYKVGSKYKGDHNETEKMVVIGIFENVRLFVCTFHIITVKISISQVGLYLWVPLPPLVPHLHSLFENIEVFLISHLFFSLFLVCEFRLIGIIVSLFYRDNSSVCNFSILRWPTRSFELMRVTLLKCLHLELGHLTSNLPNSVPIRKRTHLSHRILTMIRLIVSSQPCRDRYKLLHSLYE